MPAGGRRRGAGPGARGGRAPTPCGDTAGLGQGPSRRSAVSPVSGVPSALLPSQPGDASSAPTPVPSKPDSGEGGAPAVRELTCGASLRKPPAPHQPPTSPAPSLGAPPPGPRPGPPSLLELRPLARSPAPSLVPASGHEATPLRAPPLRRRAGSLPGELAPQAPAPDLPNPPLRVSRPRPRPAHPSLRSPSGRAASGCGEGGPGSSTMVLPVT